MEPLFTITSKYSEKEFIRFSRTLLLKESHLGYGMILVDCLIGGFLLNSLCTNFFVKDAWREILPVLSLLLIYNWFIFIGLDRKLAKVYNENKLMRGLEFQINFFGDHYETVSTNGHASIAYEKLFKIIETRTNFYLMYTKREGVIIAKEACNSSLVDFMRKIKKEYNI